MAAKRNALSAFPNTQNESELEGGGENEKLKCQFSQGERDLDLQEILKPIPIPKTRAAEKKKVTVVKDEK